MKKEKVMLEKDETLVDCFKVRLDYYQGDGPANLAEAVMLLAKNIKEAGDSISGAIADHTRELWQMEIERVERRRQGEKF